MRSFETWWDFSGTKIKNDKNDKNEDFQQKPSYTPKFFHSILSLFPEKDHFWAQKPSDFFFTQGPQAEWELPNGIQFIPKKTSFSGFSDM